MTKSEKIALTRTHVENGRAIVARQHRLVAEISTRSGDTSLPEALLWTLKQSLAIFEDELARLEGPSFVRHPARPDDSSEAHQKREFDQWRTAIELIQRLRKAGYDCQLREGFQTR